MILMRCTLCFRSLYLTNNIKRDLWIFVHTNQLLFLSLFSTKREPPWMSFQAFFHLLFPKTSSSSHFLMPFMWKKMILTTRASQEAQLFSNFGDYHLEGFSSNLKIVPITLTKSYIYDIQCISSTS